MAKVLITDATYQNCHEAIELIFQTFPLDVKGRWIMVKPNALQGAGPERAVTTHPEVIRTIVSKLESMGAGKITVGDNPGVTYYGANEKTFRDSGLMNAAKGYYQNIGKEVVRLSFPSEVCNSIMVSKAILEADILISVPKFKTHSFTQITGALKNSFGILPGAQKARFHCINNLWKFSEHLIRIFSVRIPDLFIMDAVTGMEGNGPNSPFVREIGKIIASDNAVAMDSVMARMMNLDPSAVVMIQVAERFGLGSSSISLTEIIGRLEVITNFKLPSSQPRTSSEGTPFSEFFESRLKMKPLINFQRCTACSDCVRICPQGALVMDRIPKLEERECIRCFCCQEVCPSQAIILQ